MSTRQIHSSLYYRATYQLHSPTGLQENIENAYTKLYVNLYKLKMNPQFGTRL